MPAQPTATTQSAPVSPQSSTLASAPGPQSQSAVVQAQISQQRQTRHLVSAFQIMLVLFGQLCAEDYPQSRMIPEDFVLLKEWEQCLRQLAVSAATHFLRSRLHVPDPRSIPVDGQHECMICSLPFFRLATPTIRPQYHLNMARALPCEHYFCCECLERYIEPYQDAPRDICPLCRSVFFINWSHFGYFTTLLGQVNIVGWAEKDHAAKIRLFQNWITPTEREYNIDFQRWQADSLTHFAVSGYGTTYTPNILRNAATAPSANITPRLVLHQRAWKELHFRGNMIDFMQAWIQWREDPMELRPSLRPDLFADMFKLRREQERDPTGLHEANARRRAGGELPGPN